MSRAKSKAYWRAFANKVEKETLRQLREETRKSPDLSQLLPDGLRQRVEKILNYKIEEDEVSVSSSEEDEQVDVGVRNARASILLEGLQTDTKTRQSIFLPEEHKKESFNESTWSEVEELHHQHEEFELKIDDRKATQVKEKKPPPINWQAEYIKKPRKERVIWDSKIYDMSEPFEQKPLHEQTEICMNVTVERFSEWMNTLSSNPEENVSAQKLKSMFSVDGEYGLMTAVRVEPTEVHAVAHVVANSWNMPEMSIENKYEQHLKVLCETSKKSKRKNNAFGRTIPAKELPWKPTEINKPIKTVFPRSITSGEKIFKGITHLRSVKCLTSFLKSHPEVDRPAYLVRTGIFEQRDKESDSNEKPLYEQLNLKY